MKNIIVWNGIDLMLFLLRLGLACAWTVVFMVFMRVSIGFNLTIAIGCGIAGVAVYLMLSQVIGREKYK